MDKLTLVFFVSLAALCTFAGCSCSPNAGKITYSGSGAGNNDGGPGSICLTSGSSCSASAGGVCCSGVCNAGSCSNPTFCAGPSTSCTVNTDCCSNHCLNGSCSSQQCVDVGARCTSN